MSEDDTIADSTEEIDAAEQAELSLLTENPDEWVKKQLDRAEQITMTPAEREMANLLIDRAEQYAQNTGNDFGYALSAAFDLFVTVAYYETVANTSWIYCPKEPPLLLHNFGVNACSRCLLLGEFHYYKAFKPQSGSIGKITRRLLCLFLKCLFERDNKPLKVYLASEPVDVIIYDEAERVVLLAEAKAGPLTILPLATFTEKQTESDNLIGVIERPHADTDNTTLASAPLHILLPVTDTSSATGWRIKLIPIKAINNSERKQWALSQVREALVDNKDNLHGYFDFWLRASAAYQSQRNPPIDPIFWFTGACGSPKPKPAHWPSKKTISDAKTTVGMDRTDDIKKATYQVLKIATAAKPKTTFQVKTALLSNIHAVRHYEAYLQDFQDVVWTQDESRKAKKAGELPADTLLYNLFDGILSFTRSHSRDEWISNAFQFQNKKDNERSTGEVD